MLEMFPECSHGGDAAVGEDGAVGWASRQRQGLQLMSLGEVWFGAATLAGSAGLTLGPVRKKKIIKGSNWVLKEREEHMGHTQGGPDCGISLQDPSSDTDAKVPSLPLSAAITYLLMGDRTPQLRAEAWCGDKVGTLQDQPSSP